MRYNIKCDECGKTFIAESQTVGKVKYRCPYCGNVLTCRLDAMKGKRVRPRSVVPVVSRSQAYDISGKPLSLVPAVVEKAAVVASDVPSLSEDKLQKKSRGSFLKRLWNGILWLYRHLRTFFSWASKRILRFRERYDDADLWLFIGFCLLFVLTVIVGLFVCAEFTKLLVRGQSWLFKTYLQIIHW